MVGEGLAGDLAGGFGGKRTFEGVKDKKEVHESEDSAGAASRMAPGIAVVALALAASAA